MKSLGNEDKRQFSALIECFPGVFFELDSRGDFVLTNEGARELLGLCEEVILGKRLAKRVPKSDLYKLLVIFNQAAREGRGTGNLWLIKDGAESVPVSMTVLPVREQERITGFQCIMQTTNPELEALIYPLCYELTSALTIAKGTLELALSDTNSSGRDKFIRLGRNALVRQQRVLRNLMDAIKLDRMEAELYLSELDLRELLHSVVKEFEEPYRARGRNIGLALSKDLPKVKADAEKIRNVLYTLLDYALMVWEGEAEVTVTGEKKGGFVEVCVRGAGKGSAAGKFLSLSIGELPFLPNGGIQAGLKIAEKIIKAHGGRVMKQEAASGEVVCFTLPVLEGHR